MDAVLIAGGVAPPELAAVAGHARKGLFLFEGQPLVQRVVRVLHASGIGRIAIVGSELLLAHMEEDPAHLFFVPEGRDPIENLLRGVERLGLSDEVRFLHCAVDLPMLTQHALCDWLNVIPPESDLAAAFVPDAVFESTFPGAPYRAVRFREGYCLNASLSLMRVKFLKIHAPHLQRLAAVRKSLPLFTLRLASWLGLRLVTIGIPALARFMTRRLALQTLPALAERAFSIRLHIYPHAMPELAYDIDTVDDYRYAQAWFHAQNPTRWEGG
ncbi:MAG: NTP transferase domain-containing protein [Armatimonadota bacterium]